mmetsp:Transcript_20072/g.33139  ORF Transcript_20072/g.33139 Transcript_20072/m.33139 type:complete len:307 (-) Transcript_20072:468-1388(-)
MSSSAVKSGEFENDGGGDEVGVKVSGLAEVGDKETGETVQGSVNSGEGAGGAEPGEKDQGSADSSAVAEAAQGAEAKGDSQDPKQDKSVEVVKSEKSDEAKDGPPVGSGNGVGAGSGETVEANKEGSSTPVESKKEDSSTPVEPKREDSGSPVEPKKEPAVSSEPVVNSSSVEPKKERLDAENTVNNDIDSSAGAGAGMSAQTGHIARFKRPRPSLLEGEGETIRTGTIRRIMKLDRDVKMTGSEAVFLVSKATELFVSDFVMRTLETASKEDRKLVKYTDLVSTVTSTPQLDFLADLLPDINKIK